MVQTQEFFDALQQMNVLVVGDLMIDQYLGGAVDRISPEAPVPVVRLNEREMRLGGAANVALNLAALGATPYLCSVSGKDRKRELAGALLPAQGLSDRAIYWSEERRTTVKTRVIAQHQHLLRVDEEDTHDLSPTETEGLLKGVYSLLDQKEIHLILFQDYNKGVLTPRVIREIILEAIKRDIPTAVDPKSRNFWAYKRIGLFKPNLSEVRAQLSVAVTPDEASLREAARYIHRKLDNPYTLITLSEKGLFITDQREYYLLPTVPRDIADVCGAGDTVVSVAAAGMALGLPLKEIATLANLAGGQVCERVGVVPVQREQLLREYEAYRPGTAVKK